MIFRHYPGAIALTLLLLLSFQNCGPSFTVMSEDSFARSSKQADAACPVENGEGEWDDPESENPVCLVISCHAGHKNVANACVPAANSCPITNGNGELDTDGVCRAVDCAANFHLNEDQTACDPDRRACAIDNGTGEQVWDGAAYGACAVKSCNSGYEPRARFCVPVPPSPPYAPPATGLRSLGAANGILMGAAVKSSALAAEAAYIRTLHENYDYLVAENDMKFALIQPERGKFDFRKGDALVEFGIKYGAKVRGHALVWHNQNPAWLTNGNFTPAEKMQIMRTHIQTVMRHYKDKYPGRVVAWDVVNESFDGLTANYRNTIWSPIGNEEYIRAAFQYAHEADPSALLFYNDFYNETSNPKAEAIFNLISKLKGQGVPIHGVGMQVHLSSEYDPPSVANLRTMIRRYAAIGVKVEYTEFDVRTDNAGGVSAAEAARSVLAYRNVVQACREEAPNCRGVITWGFTTKHSWIPSSFPGFVPMLPFDANYAPTPEFNAIREALR